MSARAALEVLRDRRAARVVPISGDEYPAPARRHWRAGLQEVLEAIDAQQAVDAVAKSDTWVMQLRHRRATR